MLGYFIFHSKICLFIILNLLLTGFVPCMAQKYMVTEHLNYTNNINEHIRFVYSDTAGSTFLRQLREENMLSGLIRDCNTDLEKLYQILDWTSKQWAHSGTNIPSANDALTILREAKKGNRFRCVEYGIVLCSSLNSIGLKARVVGLKTKTAETSEYGAGHVLTEVFIKDYNKWVMADPQFNIVPLSEELPLNAVEFQKYIADGLEIKLCNLNGPVHYMIKNLYMSFIPKYLFYYDVPFDNRLGLENDGLKIEGKTKLMLVPLGAKNPEVFQITEKIDYCFYTNSIQDFYKAP